MPNMKNIRETYACIGVCTRSNRQAGWGKNTVSDTKWNTIPQKQQLTVRMLSPLPAPLGPKLVVYVAPYWIPNGENMKGGIMVPENVTCPVVKVNPPPMPGWLGFRSGSGRCPAGLLGVVDLHMSDAVRKDVGLEPLSACSRAAVPTVHGYLGSTCSLPRP